MDWAGIILERVTGTKLNDYFQTHIFKPLGISHTTMFPTSEMASNLAYMHQRDPATGACDERDHIYRRAFRQTTKEEQETFFHSGGAGLFARPKEYVKVLGMLLNDGASPTTGQQVLKKETVQLMWENQIPDQPNFARGGTSCHSLALPLHAALSQTTNQHTQAPRPQTPSSPTQCPKCIRRKGTHRRAGASACSSPLLPAPRVEARIRDGGLVSLIAFGGSTGRRALRALLRVRLCRLEMGRWFLRGLWRRRRFMMGWCREGGMGRVLGREKEG